MLRPGRFDRLIYVPEPDEESRLQILQIYTEHIPLAKDVDLTFLSRELKGYSGADIQAICNEAAMNTMRRDERVVIPEDFKKAMDKMGPTITPEMEGWYKSVAQQFRKATKPTTNIA